MDYLIGKKFTEDGRSYIITSVFGFGLSCFAIDENGMYKLFKTENVEDTIRLTQPK